MNFLKQIWLIIFVIILIFLVMPIFVSAHPGRTASDGCHYCRTNCDRWGVPWNQRHCHGGYIAPLSTPKPIIKLIPTPNTSANIFTQVQNNQTTYYKNPHWFREKLINDLVNEFGSQYIDIISRLVYTLLPDTKN